MLIQRKQTENKGIFYVQTGAGIQAELTYHMSSPCQMIIEHTEVDEELRGQNMGYQLVHAAVEYARQHHVKITVWCPFAKKIFDKKPEWSDVLVK